MAIEKAIKTTREDRYPVTVARWEDNIWITTGPDGTGGDVITIPRESVQEFIEAVLEIQKEFE